MGEQSKIQWTDATWSPVRGCSMVSPGCTNCYAMAQAHRWPQYGKLTRHGPHGMVWTGRVNFVEALLTIPLGWASPRLVFVNSQSDTFHVDVSFEDLDLMFAIMALCRQHVFQVLTKRDARMRAYFSDSETGDRVWHAADRIACKLDLPERHPGDVYLRGGPSEAYWPLPNVWLGVSAEDEKHANERIPALLKTPAAVRFVSCEPLLAPIDFNNLSDGPENLNALTGLREDPFGDVVERRLDKGLDWVIVGGESGPRARSADLAWIRSIVEQCAAAHVPVFVKQLGAKPYDTHPEDPARRRPLYPKDRKGGEPLEWPDDLRVRQFPEVLDEQETAAG